MATKLNLNQERLFYLLNRISVILMLLLLLYEIISRGQQDGFGFGGIFLLTLLICTLYYLIHWTKYIGLMKPKYYKNLMTMFSIYALFLIALDLKYAFMFYMSISISLLYYHRHIWVKSRLILNGLLIGIYIFFPLTINLGTGKINIPRNPMFQGWLDIWSITMMMSWIYFAVYQEKTKAKILSNQKELERLAKYEERQMIAQEIHDVLGHSLTALTMHLEHTSSIIMDKSSEAALMIEKMQTITKEALDHCRHVNFIKEELDSDFVLYDALEDLETRVNLDNKMTLSGAYLRTLEDQPNYLKQLLFTCLREGVTNAIKHSQGSYIYYDISLKNGNISLFIKDNGKGCHHLNMHRGLSGIEDRVKALNGSLKIIRDHGFQIQVLIPMEAGFE